MNKDSAIPKLEVGYVCYYHQISSSINYIAKCKLLQHSMFMRPCCSVHVYVRARPCARVCTGVSVESAG